MKIRIDFLDNDIEISNENIFVLECENRIYFYRIVTLFNQLANGEADDAFKVYEREGEVNCLGKTDIFIDYFNLDFSNKKYQTKLIELLNSTLDADDISKLNSEFRKIQKIIESNLSDIDLPITLQKDIELDNFIKVLKLSIKKKDSILNNLLLIIDIEKTFHLNKFLVFVNLKQYISKEEQKEFYKYALYNGISILLIDSQAYGVTNQFEKKLLIDNNLDEFML